MSTQNTIKAVRKWGVEKGIIGPNGKATEKSQLTKLIEEVEELTEAVFDNDLNEKIDAIGDCTVVLILLADIMGVSFEDCLESAYQIISKRTGHMVDGVFVKDK